MTAEQVGAAVVGGDLDGVLFDIDDTLVDTRSAFGTAMATVAAVYLPHVPAQQYAEVLAVWRRDAGGHYRAYTRGDLPFRRQRHLRANELQETFGGQPVAEEKFDAWDAVFEAAFEGAWTPHDDALAAIDAIVGAGVAVGALSNASSGYQTRKLECAGLAHVPMLVGVDTLGFGKPDPRVFLEACRRLGTAPSRTLYVGDELDFDARAALAAGLQAVWIDRPGSRRGGSYIEDPALAAGEGIRVVTTLAEIVPLVVEP
ncbi:HAD family hydrolase [Sanguibacter antarcticus]|uniref:Putative hydrolase of the HAD superfamily n=1 Tax=Sanguibacter antarcticus TaxID=372484 RepID=A0A2A9E174_9MICO|nr:HAD family hydrolase [Sanguibacter antarcticus]PFG32698.1 putative hydrolase of the HAD superfamily [Sanguibacter antarcticus]